MPKSKTCLSCATGRCPMHQLGCGKCVEYVRTIDEAWRILDSIQRPVRLPDVLKVVGKAIVVLAGEYQTQKARADAAAR